MSQHSHIRGCLWMVVGGLLFVAVTVLVRLLGSDMPAVQAAFIRYLIGVMLFDQSRGNLTQFLGMLGIE